MKVKPLISVIINCHNGEKYLHSCIKSIINQSYKKWELIFFDNASIDNSAKIIRGYKDKRIKYFYYLNIHLKKMILSNLYILI